MSWSSDWLIVVVLAGLVVYVLVAGGPAAWLASEKGRGWGGWLLLGVFLGPIAVMMVGFAPPLYRGPMWMICGWCKEPFRSGALHCPHCTQEIVYVK